MATFRNINLLIRKTSMYGRDVVVYTNDSECFDWLNDDSNKEKHLQAKRHAYSKVVEQYKTG